VASSLFEHRRADVDTHHTLRVARERNREAPDATPIVHGVTRRKRRIDQLANEADRLGYISLSRLKKTAPVVGSGRRSAISGIVDDGVIRILRQTIPASALPAHATGAASELLRASTRLARSKTSPTEIVCMQRLSVHAANSRPS